MNEELRKKLPKEMVIKGVKGKLARAGTYFSGPNGWVTYLEYRFKTEELNDKLKVGKKKCRGK